MPALNQVTKSWKPDSHGPGEIDPSHGHRGMIEWRLAAPKISDPGLGLIEAQMRGQGRNSLRERGPCRFHDNGNRHHKPQIGRILSCCVHSRTRFVIQPEVGGIGAKPL